MKPVSRWLWLVCISLFLAACSTPRSPHSTSRTSSTKTASTKGGGYYMDDGPADSIPVNLDAIPDAVPKKEPLNRFANRPYTALGETYVPEEAADGYEARGVASWYGKKFHGKKTSSGEDYDMFSMTGAHPTLPIPSYAKVTNVRNGKTVVVKINDRGPFHSSRLIDLSYAAAYKLGYVDNGSAEVVVQRVFPVDGGGDAANANTDLAQNQNDLLDDNLPRIPVAADGSGVFLQLGAFGSRENAESMRTRMASLAANEAIEGHLEIVSHEGLFKLRIGPFITTSRARDVAQRLNIQTVVMR